MSYLRQVTNDRTLWLENKVLISRKEALALGLRNYFTGKACPRGHVTERFVGNKGCIECRREGVRKWRKANIDYARKIERESSREQRKNDPERIRKNARKWIDNDPERRRAASRRWRKNNPEHVSVMGQARRARKRNADGFHTAEDLKAIRERQKDCCNICDIVLWGRGHVDHIMPLARGGSNWPNNLQYLCPTCNTRKSAKDPFDFALECAGV